MNNKEIQEKLKGNVLYWIKLLESDIHDENGELLTKYKDLAIDETYRGTDEYYGILDYILDSSLEIKYTCDSDKNYLGAELTMTLGGPNIYINTEYGKVEGYWDTEKIDISYEDKIGLDDYLAELYESKE